MINDESSFAIAYSAKPPYLSLARTLSPGLNRDIFEPTDSTTPAHSKPGANGISGLV